MMAMGGMGAEGSYISAGFQVIAGLQQGEMIRDNAQITKAVADLNAQYAELDAYNAETLGYTKQARYQSVIDATLGAQKTAYAAQNVDVGFGTAKEVQAESKLNGFLNQLDIKNQANEAARGYMNQARNIRLGSQAAVAQAGVNAAATQGAAVLGAFNTGLTGYSRRKGINGNYDSNT
jgi:hypothetical protein